MRGGMLQQAAYGVLGGLADARVPFGIIEDVCPFVPQGHVGVHARAVVAEERLRHERRDHVVLLGTRS